MVTVKMALNWTIEVYLGLIAIAVNIIMLVAILYYFLGEKHGYVFPMIGNSVGLTLWVTFRTLGVLLQSKPLVLISLYAFLLTAVSTMLLIDSLTRDSVDPKKMIVLCIDMTLFIVLSLDPEAISLGPLPSGVVGIVYRQDFSVVLSVLALLVGGVYLYGMILIYNGAPENLRPHTRLSLISGLIFGVASPIIVILRIQDMIPGLITFVVGIGLIPWTYALVKQPKLAYVIPFRAVRLTVVDMRNGTPLFDYTWSQSEELADDAVYSGVLQGIGMILDESLKHGGIREIKMESAVLLLQKIEDSHIASVLVATNSTRALRRALSTFSESFFGQFSQDFARSYEISKFHSADALVREHFAFIPEYK
ncbi:MAG: hypothetical protein ACFFD9_10085 [Candidatus Thorarchaeota archaeon]